MDTPTATSTSTSTSNPQEDRGAPERETTAESHGEQADAGSSADDPSGEVGEQGRLRDFFESYCGVGVGEQPLDPKEWAARLGPVIESLGDGDQLVYGDLYGSLLLRRLGGQVVDDPAATATLRGHIQVPLEVLAELRERAYRRGSFRAWLRGFLTAIAADDGDGDGDDPLELDSGVAAVLKRAEAADPDLALDMRRALAPVLRPTTIVIRAGGAAELVPGLVRENADSTGIATIADTAGRT